MDLASLYLLGITVLLCALFGVIIVRTYSPKRKARGEEPKYRMMQDDEGKRKPKEDRHER